MMGALTLQWVNGSVHLSKNAPAVLRLIAGAGLFEQEPSSHNQAQVLMNQGGDGATTNNPYCVKEGDVWEDLDPRKGKKGNPRLVKIIVVGDTHAVVETVGSYARTEVRLKSFSGFGTRGYKRHGA